MYRVTIIISNYYYLCEIIEFIDRVAIIEGSCDNKHSFIGWVPENEYKLLIFKNPCIVLFD